VTARIAHVATIDLTHRFLLLPQLRALRDAGFDVTAISAPGPWVGDIEAEGIRFVPWPSATRRWDPRADLRAFRELRGILRRERFDLVHTHNPKPGVMGRIAARLEGVPHVVNTVHGLWATPEDRLAKRVPVLATEWIAAGCSDLELYQSEEDLRWARRLGVVRPGRWAHLGNGTDLERCHPGLREEEHIRKLRAHLGIGEDELVVGTVGRMVREKGYEELFAAARTVRERAPGTRFLVLGASDPDKPDAIAAGAIEAVRDDVIFGGWREDVPELMALMDVFCLPSWREGMPRSAIEAAASGLPLVLSDIRGCREVIRDGWEGFLVPVRDPDALASALIGLLRNPELRTELGHAARLRAEERFDERRVASLVVDATTRLIAPGSSTPVVRRAIARDARAMAHLHREALPTAFLPTLGQGFMTQLYRGLVADPSTVTLVADRGGRAVGFVAATPSVAASYRRFLARRGVLAGLAAVPALIDPDVRARAGETASYASATGGLPDAEILAIAVEPEAREEGVGRALAGVALHGLARRGVAECKVVVGADNEGANRFYERVGFRPVTAISVHAGSPSNVWVAQCGS
jgi:glycosyltransferase involved in cell wall biosynthesis/ribosomal protein S18 acetylase RimI-like enzyme